MTHAFTIDKAMADEQLLGAGLGPLWSWSTWRAVLKATATAQACARAMGCGWSSRWQVTHGRCGCGLRSVVRRAPSRSW
jgi:hypothetical protein